MKILNNKPECPLIQMTESELNGLSQSGYQPRVDIGENGNSRSYFFLMDGRVPGIVHPNIDEGRNYGSIFLTERYASQLRTNRTLPLPELDVNARQTGRIGGYLSLPPLRA